MTDNSKQWALGDLLDYDLEHAPKSLVALGHPASRVPVRSGSSTAWSTSAQELPSPIYSNSPGSSTSR